MNGQGNTKEMKRRDEENKVMVRVRRTKVEAAPTSSVSSSPCAAAVMMADAPLTSSVSSFIMLVSFPVPLVFLFSSLFHIFL